MKNCHLDGITNGFMVKVFMWFLLDFTIMLQLLQSPYMSYFFTIVVWNSMKKNKELTTIFVLHSNISKIPWV